MLLIVVLSIVPHHHHQEEVCVTVIEKCEGRNVLGNYATHSHGTSERESDHDERCVLNVKYITPSNILKGGSVLEDESSLYVEYNYILACFSIYSIEHSIAQITYDNSNIVFYELTQLGLSCGLRAPPYFLS